MRKVFEIGGIVAAAVLVAFGVAAIVMGVNGRSTVQSSLKLEQIVGSPDMTPAGHHGRGARRPACRPRSRCRRIVGRRQADQLGDRARAFASYMRIHTLEATGGLTYAQMGRFTAKPGTPAKFTDGHGGTNDPTRTRSSIRRRSSRSTTALRDLWVTETALTTALNTSYMAEQLSLFGHRGRHRTAARRDRLRDPRDRRRAPHRHGARRLRQADAEVRAAQVVPTA